jgi:hypothetical protein
MWQQSRIGSRRRRQRPRQRLGLAHSDHQTGPSSFFSFRTEEAFEDYRAQDGSGTSLVSSRPHAQLEEEDPADEGANDEGRGSQEGERRALKNGG